MTSSSASSASGPNLIGGVLRSLVHLFKLVSECIAASCFIRLSSCLEHLGYKKKKKGERLCLKLIFV